MKFEPVLHEGFERIQPLEPDLNSGHDAMLARFGSAHCWRSSKDILSACSGRTERARKAGELHQGPEG
jgi:hypothetical protein